MAPCHNRCDPGGPCGESSPFLYLGRCSSSVRGGALFTNRLQWQVPSGNDPPAGTLTSLTPLFLVPVVLNKVRCSAMLDSVASENFIFEAYSMAPADRLGRKRSYPQCDLLRKGQATLGGRFITNVPAGGQHGTRPHTGVPLPSALQSGDRLEGTDNDVCVPWNSSCGACVGCPRAGGLPNFCVPTAVTV